MEYTRSLKITVEQDTNKATYTNEFDNYFDAVVFLIEELSEDEQEYITEKIKECS